MKKYHNYVFDFKAKKFLGNFEEMYKAESEQNFDSWHQEDQRYLKRKINKAILDDYNFDLILDFGCGKGSFTHLFKKKNNKVIGIDISSKAIKIASERYPDIEFISANIENEFSFNKFSSPNNIALFIEVLSYLKNWKQILEDVARNFDYILINLFLPDDPIGFIKDEKEIIDYLLKNFYEIQIVFLRTQKEVIFFGKSKHRNLNGNE